MTTTGIGVYFQYGKQSNYTTPVSPGAMTRALGMDQKLTGFETDEGMIPLGDLGTALVQKFAFGRFKGKASFEVSISNPWFWDLILGNAVTTGSGPYTHTWDDNTTVNAITGELGIDTDTDQVLQLQRMTIIDLLLSAEQEDVARGKFNFQFGDTPSTAGTSIDSSIVRDDIATPYHFSAGAIFESPSGTPVAEVQSFELSISPSIKEVPEPNSQKAVNACKGKLVITVKFTLTVKDNTWYNNIRARVEPSNNTIRLKFTNGLAGTSERSMSITLTGLGLNKYNIPAIDQDNFVVAEIPVTCRDIQVVAVNNTSSPL